jgi:hypothetical protein
MWEANRGGVDNNILLSHLLVRLSHAFLGPGHFATRLPALTGFWALLICIFVFSKRRLPVPYAVIAMLFPMLTLGWIYSFEARAYGIVLGAAGVVLVAWQNVTLGYWRRLSLMTIAIGLAAALASHPFAVLLAIPFGLAEIARSLERHRIDWPVWLAFAAATPIVIVYPALFEPMKTIDMHGTQPGISALPGFYADMFRWAIWPMILGGAIAYLLYRDKGRREYREAVFPRHETIALLGFVGAPVALIVTVVLSSSLVYFSRYGLICLIGAAPLTAYLLFLVAGGDRRTGTILAITLIGWLAIARGREAMAVPHDPRAAFNAEHPLILGAVQRTGPVVVNNPIPFFEADFYLPEPAASQLYYVQIDPEIRRRYPWQDMSDQLIGYLARYLPLKVHVMSWRDFAKKTPSFLLYSDRNKDCLYDVLVREKWQSTELSHHGEVTLYEVKAPNEP